MKHARTLLLGILLLSGIPAALAEKVPAAACTGENCMEGTARPAEVCDGDNCAGRPQQGMIECSGEDCDAIKPQSGSGPEIETVESKAAQ